MERILIKLLCIHAFVLLIAQILLLYTPFSPHLTKVTLYEGVVKQEKPPVVETIDSP
ncbi:DUF5359 family protein [Bacillus tianshenii]|nr:DUF5359 family protein [Bacillus tianshenii]